MPLDVPSASLPVSIVAPANPYLTSACRHYIMTFVRAAFESHSGIEWSGQILNRSTTFTTNDGQILLMDREGRLLGIVLIMSPFDRPQCDNSLRPSSKSQIRFMFIGSIWAVFSNWNCVSGDEFK